jgi:hypothetical protein
MAVMFGRHGTNANRQTEGWSLRPVLYHDRYGAHPGPKLLEVRFL